jgi:hypothetical protein
MTWLRRTIESAHGSGTHGGLNGDLWQALFVLPSAAQDTLSAESLRPLLSVLSAHEENSLFNDWSKEAQRVAYFACGVLDTRTYEAWTRVNPT